MRELKFRAYIKSLNKMEDVVCLNLGTMKDIIVTDSRQKNATMCIPLDDVIVIQYTGLKDKKRTEEYPDGQDIYEGDICHFGYHYNGDYSVSANSGIVKYEDGCYMLDCDDWIGLDMATISNIGIEVIGNLHQNPELLEIK